ncbi:hypothetical protein L1049_013571 [Liquidambar formosana]|uniref:Uncharacterized protein n=1 Tax=Liquidambar formosana TaxID=63359 RepID=A0AAP0RLN1_LIQFO
MHVWRKKNGKRRNRSFPIEGGFVYSSLSLSLFVYGFCNQGFVYQFSVQVVVGTEIIWGVIFSVALFILRTLMMQRINNVITSSFNVIVNKLWSTTRALFFLSIKKL